MSDCSEVLDQLTYELWRRVKADLWTLYERGDIKMRRSIEDYEERRKATDEAYDKLKKFIHWVGEDHGLGF